MAIRLKRIYDEPANDDGYRALIDRLWPRGVSRQEAVIDVWLKDIAPSAQLRQWFDHQPERFKEFAVRYQAELDANPVAERLKGLVQQQPIITLLYAAKDSKTNHAIVLRDYLSRFDGQNPVK